METVQKAFKSPYDLNALMPFREAARVCMREQLDDLIKNAPGTRAGDDIEALHDMRVASRRLRAVMSVFGQVFNPKQFDPIERKVTEVTDFLGAVRDSDVLLEFLDAKIAAAGPEAKPGLETFAAHIKGERDKQRVDLVRELDKLEKSAFEADFRKLLDEKELD